MSSTENQLLAEIEALRRVVASRDRTLLTLTRRMDQIIEAVKTDRDRLGQAVKRERELSQFVHQVLASMRDVLIVTDPEGFIVQANLAASRELGFEPALLLGIAVDSLLPPELLATYRQASSAQQLTSASVWLEIIASQGGYVGEHGLLNSAGTVAGIFRVSAEFLYSPQGKFAGAVIAASNFTRRKEAERALADSERQLRSILDGCPIPLFVIDQGHRLTHWNRACQAMTGMTAAQMIGTRDHWRTFYAAPRPCLLDLVLDGADPDTIAQHYPAGVREQQLAERVLEGESYFPKLDKWLYFTATPIRDRQGRIVAAMESSQDITERKQAEQALAENEIRLRHMLDSSPVPLFVIDRNHRLTHWNRACVALTGVTAERMIGTPDYWLPFYDAPRPVLADLVLEEAELEEATRHYPAGLRERELAERVLEGEGHFPKIGKWLYFTAAPIRDRQGRIVAAMESIQDITERKQTEQALRLAASVFEHAHEGIMITDATATIIEVNRTFEEITGYSREEVVGRNPRFLQSGHHDPAFYTTMWQTLAERGYWHGEIWNRRKNGEVFPESASISAVHNANGVTTSYVGLFADISILKESQQQLERMAYYDPLTGLPNRALLADRLRLALAKAQREQRVLAVCYLDLDGFKPINDRWGHAAGDELLIEVAQRFQQSVRGDDTVARLGGDEFVMLLGNLSSIEEGEQVLERILKVVATPFPPRAMTVSASIGATFFPHDYADPETLIRHADQAMYLAKQGGRNGYHLFDPEQDRRAQRHRELLERIRQGWAAGEFCLYYQPKVNMRHGRVVGTEALIRWRHPDQGLLTPVAFMAVIESSEFAGTLGDWVLETAIQQMAAWSAVGLTLPVSVNLSARHLQQPDFAARLQALLASYPGVRSEWLELEILETTALDDLDRVSRIFAECRQLGVRLALDDFGTGYCSLTYLKHLPAQTLKIDQSFISNMLADPGDLAIVRGIISLAAAFRLDVIAEGVESVEHGVRLLELGCDHAQGYAIARPMPAQAMPDWIAGWRPPGGWMDQADIG